MQRPEFSSPATPSNDEPLHWEDVGFNSNFVSLKNAKPGESWEGWWTGEQANHMGVSIHLQSRVKGAPKTILPVKGQLKVILERDFKLYDYIKVTYKGKVKLEKGDWAGSQAYDFDVHKAVDFSGELNMYKRRGLPIPERLLAPQPSQAPAAPAPHAPVQPQIPQSVEDEIDSLFAR